jgi:pimeloyl-ACP methyl ester carboxylesterase
MELNFKTFGQGEPLIIMHGLFGMLDNWQTLGKKWAEKYTVFLVDLRNHGKSPHSDTMDYPTMAEDIRHFMESNWVYKAHILGHSMGGKTAMQFAAMYPDMVEKLVVVDIAPKVYPERHNEIFDSLLSLDLSIDNRDDVEKHIRDSIKEEDVVLFLMKSLSRNKEGGFRFKMNLPALKENYDKILGNIKMTEAYEGSALFLRGGNSSHVLESDYPTIKEKFPEAKIQTIDGAGHWVHAEKPKELFNAVNQFLES